MESAGVRRKRTLSGGAPRIAPRPPRRSESGKRADSGTAWPVPQRGAPLPRPERGEQPLGAAEPWRGCKARESAASRSAPRPLPEGAGTHGPAALPPAALRGWETARGERSLRPSYAPQPQGRSLVPRGSPAPAGRVIRPHLPAGPGVSRAAPTGLRSAPHGRSVPGASSGTAGALPSRGPASERISAGTGQRQARGRPGGERGFPEQSGHGTPRASPHAFRIPPAPRLTGRTR